MEYLFFTFVFIFGLIIGSFINCFVWRLHKNESIMGRSYCPKCRHQINWYDNIPVISYLILGGKCRHCDKKISIQYPIVEFITGCLFMLSFFSNFQFPISNQFIILILRDWFLISVMTIIFIYDLRWYIIPDLITLPSALLIFLLNLTLGFDWKNLLISGIIGGSFFLIQFLISRGKWIGGGDIRMGLLMGFALGWPAVMLAIFLAYIIGSIIAVGLIIAKKKKWGSQIPMGIFLTTATVITLFWGNAIWQWYLGLIGF